MPDIIHLLPDSVANQIAAGEVIQRPASVVKELVENAVDAGADEIQVIARDAGRTLVQVIDNGTGMSEPDARMAFERHATSKISSANDLFSIRTMGFRGEALASIAAIAQVELRTRQEKAELGTRIEISASRVTLQEPVMCNRGSNFMIKNLFYNVPARRRFLKSNPTELRHIIQEFQKVALAFPGISFTLVHNDQVIISLPATNQRLRIIGLMGKQMNSQLIPVNIETTHLVIKGFIGKPGSARKTSGDQYLFVNNRYFRHPYLHKAIMNAYSNLIANDDYPAYFLFFEVEPDFIDVNIHPSKTEIKFEDEKLIWKILNATIRESLGKFNIVPSIDFDTEGQILVPSEVSGKEVIPPVIPVNPHYNPFNSTVYSPPGKSAPRGWESLYHDFESSRHQDGIYSDDTPPAILLPSKGNIIQQALETTPGKEEQITCSTFLQFKNRFILTPVKSGLMIIDQQRAHERVLFEKFLSTIKSRGSASQQVLYGVSLALSTTDIDLLRDIQEELGMFGFRLEEREDGEFIVTGIPPCIDINDTTQVIETIIESYKTGEVNLAGEIKEQIAIIMARAASIKNNKTLATDEVNSLVGDLLKCECPNYTPGGKTIISVINTSDLEKIFI